MEYENNLYGFLRDPIVLIMEKPQRSSWHPPEKEVSQTRKKS